MARFSKQEKGRRKETVFWRGSCHLNVVWDANRVRCTRSQTTAPWDSGESVITFWVVLSASKIHRHRAALLEALSLLWLGASPPSLFLLDILEVWEPRRQGTSFLRVSCLGCWTQACQFPCTPPGCDIALLAGGRQALPVLTKYLVG